MFNTKDLWDYVLYTYIILLPSVCANYFVWRQIRAAHDFPTFYHTSYGLYSSIPALPGHLNRILYPLSRDTDSRMFW